MTADGYSVGLVVTLPLFDGFQRENAVTTAKGRLDRATQAEGLVRHQIAKEVNQAALMLRVPHPPRTPPPDLKLTDQVGHV